MLHTVITEAKTVNAGESNDTNLPISCTADGGRKLNENEVMSLKCDAKESVMNA